MGELIHWTEIVKKNTPQTLLKVSPPQAMLAMDATELGYGAELTLISTPSSIQGSIHNSIQQSAQQYNQKLNQSYVRCPLMDYGK
jgi:hypothetical protein